MTYIMYLGSVTRLGYFDSPWITIFFTKVAQIFGDLKGYAENMPFV